MSEVLDVAMENLPYITAAGGAVVAGVGDVIAQHRIERSRKALSESWGDAFNQPMSLPRRIGRAATSALVCGALSALPGIAFKETQPPASGKRAIEVVVDRAGSTYGQSANEITSVIKGINSHGDLAAQAIVAQVGENSITTLKKAEAAQPFGDAQVPEAAQTAFDTLKVQQSENNNSNTGKRAVVVLTDGHSFGSAKQVVSQANESGVRAPVYVVNVNKDSSNNTETTFKSIAKRTGGDYWQDPSQGDINKMIGELEPPRAEARNDTSLPLKVFETAVAALGLLGYARMRRHSPLSWGGLKKNSKEPKEV